MLYMVFDVESVGLHGEGFAVGWVVVDESGTELDAKCYACPPAKALKEVGSFSEDIENRKWLRDNVDVEFICVTPMEVRHTFWTAWLYWKAQKAVLVADCAYPVETRFLAECVDDTGGNRKYDGPYPLHEVATARMLAGFDPLATVERLPSELPVHNPLADARQSARLWLEALSRLSMRKILGTIGKG